ncbi:hypothetical protein CVT25_010890 [Psilocybe cyanescens]|uniref:TFIID-31kDa-domain-containing protein n=1 Tax=Psilocybe cyanescens TaxID=93625 RepID=A0A409WFI7_PSICY|nr:hypothetical protein CVT25_010890 [Psilocybe cyanescens]
MSRPADNLPTTARAIALILSSAPSVQDVQPGVLHQLLEFSHRYTTQVLTDASVYAEHANRAGKIEMDDITLAVQARVGWEFGGRVPKEYILSLAAEVNAAPLPAVPEVFGLRLPPASECLASVDFDLIPNKPPPGVKLYEEEIEEIEESESEPEEEQDAEMEPAPIGAERQAHRSPSQDQPMREDAPFPISAIATPADIEMLGTPAGMRMEHEEGSDGAEEEEDGLFAGGDDEDEESDGMEEVSTSLVEPSNGVKRKLVEEDDYD